ncbi:MAG: DUF3575 domain-containing protein [Williamsia sp.]|nr:DUF3575 domain-containing protein [Williamsia sp.]
MRIVALLLLCSWLCQAARAQSTPPITRHYKAGLRFNFVGLADPIDNNISVGGEFPFHPSWSVTADLAYIEHSSYFSNTRRTGGYMVKPAIRFYPASFHHSGFFEAVLFYKRVNYHQRDWLGMDCVDGVPTYEQYKNFVYRKEVMGFNLQMGFQTALSSNKRFGLEGWLGLGLRVRHQDVAGEENACYNATWRSFDINGHSGTVVLSSFPAGLRLVYSIR